MRWQDFITADPTVAAGKPVVRGTRLTVEFLLRLLASGWTRDQILGEYPHLPSAGLEAALLFAAGEEIRPDGQFTVIDEERIRQRALPRPPASSP